LEKEAKTLACWGAWWIQRASQGQRFFGSFFQKRTACLFLPLDAGQQQTIAPG
jgi:hypothetical protein